jgi:trehalose 6-phosphate synthase
MRRRPSHDATTAPVTRHRLPLVTLANRLPVVKQRGEWKQAPGGLVAALRPALEARGGHWVGWDGGAAGLPSDIPGLAAQLVPVHLHPRQVQGYYHGFSNRTLWPLFHSVLGRVELDRRWWHAYREVNERFASAARATAPRRGVIWVHDYHLLLVPDLLRRAGASQRIGFFLHIPFPAPELFARLPWRSYLLDGLLGASVVSFQTEEYRANFLGACRRLREDVEVGRTGVALGDGRHVQVNAHGISIEARSLRDQAAGAAVERWVRRLRRQFGERRVVLGVDRLDYTKGIVERLEAIELLLEQRPELRSRVVFVQVAVPSRGEILEYGLVRSQVEELVGRINGRFTSPGGDVPVHYLYRGVSSDRLLAYYRLADVCLVTPLRDGMNLVAKEFVTCQAAGAGAGVLVLSEFAGAAEGLHGALPCNPFDVVGLAATIELALELDEADRAERIAKMAVEVERRDVFWWLECELAALEGQ